MSDDDDLFGSDLELEDGADRKGRVDADNAGPTTAGPAASDDDLFGSDDDVGEPVAVPDLKPKDAKPFRTPSKPKVFGPSRTLRKHRDRIRIGGTGTELCTVKMPTWMDADRDEFRPDRVRQEIVDCDGDASHIAHKIRWRTANDDDGNEFRESNARFVTWSDGSMQMLVGSLVFDIVKTPLPANLHYLYDQADVARDQAQQCRAAFTSKLLVQPAQALVVHVPKRQKVVHTPVQTAKKIVTTTDPEKEVEEKIRRYRLKEMRESARERAQRFVPPPGAFSADFLEYSDDDVSSVDETPRRRIFDDDEAAHRLLSAKRGEDVKGRAIIKKKERKDKVEKAVEEPGPESEPDEDVEVHHKAAAKRRHVIDESDSD